MTYPIVELTFWNEGDPGTYAIDALLADPSTPLAKHGLTGIASVYSESTGAFLHERHRWWAKEMAMKSLAVDGALTEVVPALQQAGIPFFVAKGPTIAYGTYSTARMRPYCDLDVYVARGALAGARCVLNGIGYHEVEQKRGQLGGVGRELHGGKYGSVVEVHDTIVDNLHRRYLPGTSAYLVHAARRRILGADVPVLDDSAHLALQAIHLAAGHRYAKAILFRDIQDLLTQTDRSVVNNLGAGRYLDTVAAVLPTLRGVQSPRVAEGSVLQRRLAAALATADPIGWNEHGVSTANVLALLNQPTLRHKARAAMAGSRALLPARGRRVRLVRSNSLRRESAPA